MNKLLKGSIILFIICLLFVTVAVVSADDTDKQVMTLSKGGITIKYPSDWVNCDSSSNYSIMSIGKESSVNAMKHAQISINIEKKPIDTDFNTFVNSTYESMKKDSSYDIVSSGASMVGDKEGLEYIYTHDQNGVKKEHKAVWFEKGGQAYVLLYSAPVSDFESNLYVFDYILSDIQIT